MKKANIDVSALSIALDALNDYQNEARYQGVALANEVHESVERISSAIKLAHEKPLLLMSAENPDGWKLEELLA